MYFSFTNIPFSSIQIAANVNAISSTGYGWHGDYLFGWKGTALQTAMDERCSGDACAKMKTQTAAEANACMLSKAHVNEQINGCKFTSKPSSLFLLLT